MNLSIRLVKIRQFLYKRFNNLELIIKKIKGINCILRLLFKYININKYYHRLNGVN